jgi:hypothetical protein
MQYLIYTDPDTGLDCRDGARAGKFCEDAELTATGFDGTENIDWENMDNITPQ